MPASLAFFLLRFACDFETFSPVSAARMTDCGGAIVAGAGLAVGCSTKLPTIMPGMNFLGFWAARGGGARCCCCVWRFVIWPRWRGGQVAKSQRYNINTKTQSSLVYY